MNKKKSQIIIYILVIILSVFIMIFFIYDWLSIESVNTASSNNSNNNTNNSNNNTNNSNNNTNNSNINPTGSINKNNTATQTPCPTKYIENNPNSNLYPHIDNVAMLVDMDLNLDDIIYTEGYYIKDDGGGALYCVVENPFYKGLKNVELKNGLYAQLMNEDAIYVEQFGAIGDGVHDDTEVIDYCLNSSYEKVIFSNKEYKICNHIIIYTSNKTVIGNGAVLFTDNDYRSRDEYVEWIYLVQGDNLVFEGLKFEARENILVGYKTQMGLWHSNNISLINCIFSIPSTVYEYNDGTKDVEYRCLDLYSDWYNILIDNCTFSNYADTYRGGCLDIRDIKGGGCSKASIINSIFISNCHDEIIALFSNQKGNGVIQNVEIKNNIIKALSTELSRKRDVGISLGYKTNKVYNISFTENDVSIYTRWVCFTIGNGINVTISNNNINVYTYANESIYSIRHLEGTKKIAFTNNIVNIYLCKGSKYLGTYGAIDDKETYIFIKND